MESQPIPPPPPTEASLETSSLTDRLTNIVTAPGEVFAEIKNAPVQTANWLVPLILSCIAAVFYTFMAFSQPAITSGIAAQREKVMQKQVAAGKLTQAQADQAIAMTARFMTPTMLKIFGAAGAILASVSGLFGMGAVIWLALKNCARVTLAYMKVVEVCGLALVIDVLQKILRGWLVVWKENLLSTASPALFLANPDAGNKLHVFLSIIDIVDFWWLAILSLGIAKVAGVRPRTATFIIFGIWFGFRIVLLLLTPSTS